MATETEIERLVVRLVGDNSPYKLMLKDSEDAARNAAKAVESEVARIAAGGDLTQTGLYLHQFNQQLLERVDRLGKSAEAFGREKMAAGGATENELKMLDALLAHEKVLSRQEDAFARKEMYVQRAAGATNQYAQQVDDLRILLEKGGLTQEQYNKNIQALHSEHLVQTTQGLADVSSKVAIFTGLLSFGAAGIRDMGIKSAAAYEETEVAFGTMMGSAEKAKSFLSELTAFAVKTPFEMPELENVSRQLIMFGESQQSVMETTEMLGNVAAGVGRQHFNMLGIIYNQIRGVGHLLTGDFRQMATRGAVSLQDIAKYYKVTDAAAMSMISHGKVSFEDFRTIMMATTKEGGRFAGMMEKKSETMGGLMSTYSDAQGIAMRKIAENFLPAEKAWLKFKIFFMDSIANMQGPTAALVSTMVGVGAAAVSVTAGISGTVYIGSQALSVYKSITTQLETLSETSRAATVAMKGLTAAKYAASAAGLGLAAATAAVIGYNLGGWLYEQTKRAEAWNRAAKGIKESTEALANIKFSGKSYQEMDTYVKGLEVRVEKARKHQETLEKGWFTGETAKANKPVVQAQEDHLKAAKTRLGELTDIADDPTLQKRLKLERDELVKLKKEADGYKESLSGTGDRAKPKATGLESWKPKWWDELVSPIRSGRIRDYQASLDTVNAKIAISSEAVSRLNEKLAWTGIEGKTEADVDKTMADIKNKTIALKDEVKLRGLLEDAARREGKAVSELSEFTKTYIKLTQVDAVGRREGDSKSLQNKEDMAQAVAYASLMEQQARQKSTEALDKEILKNERKALAIGKTKEQAELLKLVEAGTIREGDTKGADAWRQSEHMIKVKEALEAAVSPAKKFQREVDEINKGVGRLWSQDEADIRIRALSNTQRDAVLPAKKFKSELDELYARFAGDEPRILEEHLKSLREQLTGVKDKGREAAVVIGKLRDEAAKSGDVQGGEERVRRYIQSQAGLQDPARDIRERREQMRRSLSQTDFRAWEADAAKVARQQVIPAEKLKVDIEGQLEGMKGQPELIQRQAEAWLGLKNPIRDTTEQMNAYVEKLREAGMTAEQLKGIQSAAWRQQLDPLRSLKDEVSEVNRKLAASGDIRARDEAFRQMNRSITDSFDPTAKYADRVADLDLRHKKGGLSQKDYDLAMQEAKKSLGQLTEAELEQIAAQTRKMDAVRAGTDAMRQTQQYALEFLAQNTKAGEQMFAAEQLNLNRPRQELGAVGQPAPPNLGFNPEPLPFTGLPLGVPQSRPGPVQVSEASSWVAEPNQERLLANTMETDPMAGVEGRLDTMITLLQNSPVVTYDANLSQTHTGAD